MGECEHKLSDQLYFPVMVPPDKPNKVWYVPVPTGFGPPFLFLGKEHDIKPQDCFKKCIYCDDYFK
jgi:hypothetical protein